MIMRFRPANIRLINRRSNLLRLLLALSSGNNKSNDKKQTHRSRRLTRSLHIRPMHSPSREADADYFRKVRLSGQKTSECTYEWHTRYTSGMRTSFELSIESFADFTSGLIGLPVSRAWQGYGSAIFLEFGRLQSTRKRDGQPGSPRGEWTLFIEWSWRIEGKRRIWCGSWSDGERWPRAFARLQNGAVASIQTTGRLPEIDFGLTNGLHLLSTMTAEGNPAWALIKRKDGASQSVGVSGGRLYLDNELADKTS